MSKTVAFYVQGLSFWLHRSSGTFRLQDSGFRNSDNRGVYVVLVLSFAKVNIYLIVPEICMHNVVIGHV